MSLISSFNFVSEAMIVLSKIKNQQNWHAARKRTKAAHNICCICCIRGSPGCNWLTRVWEVNGWARGAANWPLKQRTKWRTEDKRKWMKEKVDIQIHFFVFELTQEVVQNRPEKTGKESLFSPAASAFISRVSGSSQDTLSLFSLLVFKFSVVNCAFQHMLRSARCLPSLQQQKKNGLIDSLFFFFLFHCSCGIMKNFVVLPFSSIDVFMMLLLNPSKLYKSASCVIRTAGERTCSYQSWLFLFMFKIGFACSRRTEFSCNVVSSFLINASSSARPASSGGWSLHGKIGPFSPSFFLILLGFPLSNISISSLSLILPHLRGSLKTLQLIVCSLNAETMTRLPTALASLPSLTLPSAFYNHDSLNYWLLLFCLSCHFKN